MVPRELIDTAMVPGGVQLRLVRRGADYMILLDRNELMNSRMSGSEEALAEMTADRMPVARVPHMLIGGYGMGFTLRAALAKLGADAKITVVELVPEIVDWARDHMAGLTGGCLEDPRVELVIDDVVNVINASEHAFDAILLDVDNGPDGLTSKANGRLYSQRGLAEARSALRPGGILAIWSAAPDPNFARKLEGAGFDVDEVVVRARSNGKGPRHIIWFATKT